MKQQLVLIVENGLMNRKKVSDSLLRKGYDVRFASDVESALRIFTQTRPFFVLVSLIMLQIDCRTFSRIIKNDVATRDVPVVGFAAVSKNDAVFWDADFDGFINMSESSTGLVKKIRMYLAQLENNL